MIGNDVTKYISNSNKKPHRLSAFPKRLCFIKDSIFNAVLSRSFSINTLINRLVKSWIYHRDHGALGDK